MMVASLPVAAAPLPSLDPPPWTYPRARAVQEIEALLARAFERRGITLDRAVVEAAAHRRNAATAGTSAA
jgi:hypothetical protein